MGQPILHSPSAPVPSQDARDLDTLVKRFAQIDRPHYDLPIASGDNGLAALQDILAEIDETVLPRRITLRAPDGQSLDLLVSNRRLLALAPCDTARRLAQQSPEDVARLFASDLQTFIAAASTVCLQKPQPLTGHHGADLSVSAALLRAALGIDHTDTASDPHTDAAKPPLCSAASAWVEVRNDGAVLSEHGPVDQITSLKAFWKAYAGQAPAPLRQTRIQTHAPQHVFLPLQGPAGIALFTQDQETWILALTTQAQFQALL